MLFSSLIFIYAFLPLVLILNFLLKVEYRNKLLLISSIIFFAWGGVMYTLILVASLAINYITGLFIYKYRETAHSKTILFIGILLNILLLGVFKYAGFIVENINYFYAILNWKPIKDPGIVLPLGISFYTFQAMSYIIDLYRRQANVQKNFFKLALYISFFPQLIAGPIVRYNLIEKQLSFRKNHMANLSYGIQRFMLGMIRKVVFANQFGLVADKTFSLPFEELSTGAAWIGILAYSLQIYFDFSGYSDMAIGLGRMFGFTFPENFNFPYISKSIREFWTRWHMTLSGWFKSYLYVPLGGNRKGLRRTIFNLLIVFFATSIWHGASWNFVVWGMLHGLFMMLERLGLEKLIQKLWSPLQYAYVLLIVVVTWVFFRVEDASSALYYCYKMFSFDFSGIHTNILEVVNNELFYVIAFFGILSCTKIWVYIIDKMNIFYTQLSSSVFKMSVNLSRQVALTVSVVFAILICTMFLIGDTYNPFIYFRF